ncbi:MAG: SsgA family sporulation/cell division regulator [Nocardioidaceae bacterium]|nr:SsgA family sporulation/cell division regulator [Nocardioidaceae bacterium]
MDTPVSVTHDLTLELIDASGTATPLAAKLRYDNSDPYAISASFNTGDIAVQWVFSRALLAAGVYEPTGDGDVHVWPCLDARGRSVTIIELSSPDGEALMQARSDEVCVFLRRTEDLVPSGSEGTHVDIDDVIARLLR